MKRARFRRFGRGEERREGRIAMEWGLQGTDGTGHAQDEKACKESISICWKQTRRTVAGYRPGLSKVQPLLARFHHGPKQVSWGKQGNALAGLVKILLHPPLHAGAVCGQQGVGVYAPRLDALACKQRGQQGPGEAFEGA